MLNRICKQKKFALSDWLLNLPKKVCWVATLGRDTLLHRNNKKAVVIKRVHCLLFLSFCNDTLHTGNDNKTIAKLIEALKYPNGT